MKAITLVLIRLTLFLKHLIGNKQEVGRSNVLPTFLLGGGVMYGIYGRFDPRS